MSEKTLSPKMQEALSAMSHDWQSSYSLRVSLATLGALWSRGLVERQSGVGSMFSPRTAIKWRLKP